MKYKLAGEDDDTFKIQNDDGSQFSIAKNAVGPEVHKRIKSLQPIKMADDGQVPDFLSQNSSQDVSDKDAIDAVSQTPDPMKEQGRLLERYEKLGVGGLGGSAETRALVDYDALKNLRSANPESLSTYQAQRLRDLEGIVGGTPQQGPAPASLPASPTVSMPESQPLMQQQVAPQKPNPVQPQIGGLNDAYANAFAQKESGIQGVAHAQAQAGQQQAQAYQDQVNQIDQQQAKYEAQHAQIDAEHKQLVDAITQEKIDPNRFYKNMSTGNNILAAISVALGGIGSGLTGKPNLALDVINKAEEQDIESQRAELGKKQNLLSENVRRYGDLNTATQMTRLQFNAATQAKVAQAAARSGSAQAVAQAKVILGDLGMQAAQIKRDAAIKQMASQGGNYDPAVFVPHVVPKEHQKAVFDEIQRAQDTRTMGSSILKSFDQAANENTVLKTGAGMLRTPPSVLALHQSMQPTFKDLEGTVRQAAMDNTFKNITPAPGDASSTIKVKRQALQDYLRSKASAPTAKGFGIDLDKFNSTTTQQEPETQTMNGVKYQKVQGGWKKI